MDLPQHMSQKRLASGGYAYYWRPRDSDIANGFTLTAEPLGKDMAAAITRAHQLNQHLSDWRMGRGAVKSLDNHSTVGSLDWLIERYMRSPAWDKVSARARPDYLHAFKLLADLPRKSGGRVGAATLTSIDALAVDKLYAKLKTGPRGPRKRQAVLCIQRAARAWDVVARLYPKSLPQVNPFRNVELVHGSGTRLACTREEAYALSEALIAAREPHLAACALICFEWHQRPENILAGHLSWTDYRPADRPQEVRIVHHKTGVEGWLRLDDCEGPLFPELCAALDSLQRLGIPMILRTPRRAAHGHGRPTLRSGLPRQPITAEPFSFRDARTRVARARKAAGLPSYLTLDACRHGGLTELGDAGLTEQQEMALSGHTTPDAMRGYVKKTETQRRIAARTRRVFVETLQVAAEQKAHTGENDRVHAGENEKQKTG